MKEPLYVCVYVPEFPAQSLLRLRPELSRNPIVILVGNPPLETVCSANAQAFRLGVMQGMSRSELDSIEGLTLLKRSAAEEQSARAALLQIAGTFTPRVEIQTSMSNAFIMVLDMSGTSRIFGPPPQMVSRISKAVSTLTFFAHFASSANLHTAVCMAPSAKRAPVFVPASQEKKYLRDLPLAALSLTAQQAEVLQLWGLRTMGELADLPEVELVVRLGQQGKRLRFLARGEYPHLMVPEEPVFTLEEFLAFDTPLEILDSLLFVLGPMIDQLVTRARNRALALASITVKFGLDGCGEHIRTIKPAIPVIQRDVLLKLLHLDLQSHPPSAGILNMFVSAEPGDHSKVQLGLFAPQLPEPLHLDVTLARIASLVGDDRVGRAKLLDTHHSDNFRMERFTIAKSPEKRLNKSHSVALRRCRPPWHLLVQQEGQRLSSFVLHGKRYTVQEAYGPWRKSGTWWSAEIWSREEWDVRATAMADDTLLCLITHDLLRHSWQLEAFYD